MNKEILLSQALERPGNKIGYFVGEQLAKRYPDKYVLETSSLGFDRFARAGHCSALRDSATFNQIESTWHGPEFTLMLRNQNAWVNVQWQNHELDIVQLEYSVSYCNQSRFWVIADSREVAEAFYRAVCEWDHEVRQEILVFENGYWVKSQELYQTIRAASFDNLILPAQLKEQLREDLSRFFSAREMYEELNIPWKRGALLIGPPGNGKTHAVKAVVNHLGKACLYVKTFVNQYEDENAIKEVFDKARQMAPCVLVMEDLDSLVNAQTRSFFLNEMDGFERNHGIAVLATTNYPEKLDPAILNRPSRFDRKYYFKLPTEQERLAYLALWNQSAKSQVRLSAEGMKEIAHLTNGFSFAYIKELMLTSLMRWINEPIGSAMDAVMRAQVALLKEQMAPTEEAAAAAA
ncbi:MAG TPA: ATP-binding protein [Blastocatellia bacterium]|nr:ATP-binding protein [Blastocatellia bacterium]